MARAWQWARVARTPRRMREAGAGARAAVAAGRAAVAFPPPPEQRRGRKRARPGQRGGCFERAPGLAIF
eukprot:1923440-Alexandrium_andersonii.AAC.1